MRVKVSPKTSSQSAGCTVRVRMSVGSWRSLRTSHSAMFSVLRTKSSARRHGEGAAPDEVPPHGIATGADVRGMAASAEPAGGTARSGCITEAASTFQHITCVVGEHVIQGGVGLPDGRLEIGGRADGGN